MIRKIFFSIIVFSISIQANVTRTTPSPKEKNKLGTIQQKTIQKNPSKEKATLTPPSKVRRLAAGSLDLIFKYAVFIQLSYNINLLHNRFYTQLKLESKPNTSISKYLIIQEESFPLPYVITKSLLLFFIVIVISTLLEYYRGGYGKRVFGLKIVDKDGNPPTLKMLFIRTLSTYISIPLIFIDGIYPIPIIWITIPFTSLSQSIPDLIAGTRVIYIENKDENIEQKLITKLYEAIATKNTTTS